MDISDFKDEEEYAAQMEAGALLNPRVDTTFKALFTQPTPDSRGALRSFIEAATERKLDSVELAPNDAPAGFGGQRGVSYDIHCVFNDGETADVEMQAFNQSYDYGKRAEYQVARLETTYLKKGAGWEQAPKAYQITVLDFNYKPRAGGGYTGGGGEEAAPVSRYAMRTRDGRGLSGTLNVIFIELPKAAGLEESLESNTALENWAVFLRDADKPGKREVIERLTRKEDGLMYASRALSAISTNRAYWLAQYRQELYERDRISSMTACRDEGFAAGRKEGLAEGRKEGLAEGERNACLKMARDMLADGIPPERVAKWTGLSAEEVGKL